MLYSKTHNTAPLGGEQNGTIFGGTVLGGGIGGGAVLGGGGGGMGGGGGGGRYWGGGGYSIRCLVVVSTECAAKLVNSAAPVQ